MKYFTKEVQIALVAIVGLVVLFFGLQFLKGINLTSSDARYYAQFDDMSGLSANCPVYADGYKVGIVKDIIFNYGGEQPNVAVLDIDAQMRLPKGEQVPAGGVGVIDLLLACSLCPSKSEARRLITQGGLTVDEEKITAIDRVFSVEQLKAGLKIRKGKKVYHKALLK